MTTQPEDDGLRFPAGLLIETTDGTLLGDELPEPAPRPQRYEVSVSLIVRVSGTRSPLTDQELTVRDERTFRVTEDMHVAGMVQNVVASAAIEIAGLAQATEKNLREREQR